MSHSATLHGELDHSVTDTRSRNTSPRQSYYGSNPTHGDGSRSRIDRPKSSPSTANNLSSSIRPTLTSSYSYASTSSASTARPSASSRPKTFYHQALTWKENLDAFNRRLRRGSVSLDAFTQEEEQLLYSQENAQAQSAGHLNQPGVQDEQIRLLGNTDPSKQSIRNSNYAGNSNGAYGATTSVAAGLSSSSQNRASGVGGRSDQNNRGSDPVFPTQLNPALATTSSSKLGVISGVFVPCVLSIWGIILFLRFGFIIAQAGVIGTMAMFIVGYAINIFTSLSLSAISTNGTVRGGGVYYLLSRSLGPEFGGSIGLIYFLCTILGCGMNVLGFVEPLISNFGESSGTVYRVLPEGWGWGFVYGTILLISCTLICLVGSKLFARSSLVLAVVILLSTLSIFISFALMPPFTHPERNIEYTGFSWETLQENMWPKFTTTGGPEGAKQSFQTVFGVLFPACIGILAGASMSGDLEDPSKSIPSGTLWAVGSTFFVYTLIVILMGGSISRSTMYSDLSVLQDVSISPLFIASGALAASIFATLGSVIGAAKILQAIARDNLLPLLAVFGQGTPNTDEPTLAVLLTYALCQLCLFLTDMNAIATFVSLITLLTFLILNFACFLLKIGSAPNFRPSFRFFHWWTAFGGIVLCATVMGFVDLGRSILSGLLTAILFIWIHYWSPPKRWGDVTQSLIYHQVRKYLLRLDSRKEHVKFWRPQILLLVHHPRSEYQLIQFCNHLKKGALYVLGHVILGDLRDVLVEYRRQQGSWLKFVDVLQIKAFVNLSVAESVRIGARNLLIGTGLGGMRPNIVVMGSFNLRRYLKEKQQHEQQNDTPQMHPHSLNLQKSTFTQVHNNLNNQCKGHTLLNIPVTLPIDNIRVEASINVTDYVSIIEDVLSLNKAVAIGYGFERLELPEEHKSIWKVLSSLGSGILPSSIFPHSSSRPSSVHKVDENKKKYIDLWPMQMSIAPTLGLDPGQHPNLTNHKRASRDPSSSSPIIPGGGTFPESYGTGPGGPNLSSRMAEGNLTNFDTYAMVLQMGCILHMVPQWKENYSLRVMVFVEYLEDVEEEKKRLAALLENLRIPAEVKVMCLNGGDSETYERLISGEVEPSTPDDYQYDSDIVEQSEGLEGSENDVAPTAPIAPVAQRLGPRNINPNWQHYALLEEEEDENVSEGEGDRIQEDGQNSSHETGPYSNVTERRVTGSKSNSSSSSRFVAGKPMDASLSPKFQEQVLLPHRRRTISHPSNTQQMPRNQGPNNLQITTASSPRPRQGSPISGSHAHPSTPHYFSSGVPRRRNTQAGPMSPLEARLGTSVPLGTSMNFRIAVPLPPQYFEVNGPNSSGSESDSISSEDDDDYDRNDDDLYGGLYPPQQPQSQQQYLGNGAQQRPVMTLQQQTQPQQLLQQTPIGQQQVKPSAFAHTSLGSDNSLGTVLKAADNINQVNYGQHDQYSQEPPHPLNPSIPPGDSSENVNSPWPNSLGPTALVSQEHGQDLSFSYSASPPEGDLNNFSALTPLSPLPPVPVDTSSPRPSLSYSFDQNSNYDPSPQSPIQFDNLSPEAQLMIMNELMRIHSSAETTSIVFTTVPAPEVGTCLREQSSVAYLEKLDLLMDGIDVPVLLLHAKSLTVTMTL
ncbi:hypothetical protein BGZ46_001153 [Entomortierella lignicola]|nr:hypothetical protein BGZ46_001153 [Entomortierella lignicola]